MKYDSATIEATDGTTTETVDLDGMTTEAELIGKLWELFPLVDEDGDDEPDTDEMPDHVTLTNPQGFAAHMFSKSNNGHTLWNAVSSFDELLEAWSNETDSDRREAMGEYLDDMGADDLSDFDEAYQGQYDSGAAFAENMAEGLGVVPTENTWICIDWERTWESSVRHDYHITDSGHVFRNL